MGLSPEADDWLPGRHSNIPAPGSGRAMSDVGKLVDPAPHPGGAWVTDEGATVGLTTGELAQITANARTASEWVRDPRRAEVYAQTHAKVERYPPHWLRCDFVKDNVRCCRGSDHEKGVGEEAQH